MEGGFYISTKASVEGQAAALYKSGKRVSRSISLDPSEEFDNAETLPSLS